ncbi:hypothetical protein M885DRAFT_613289 [Pelagophyceae sp. CCMP2097]|nr:hypothetical protein M885DRAFT_613289 [Pelagophyceae sp. CCMP2097]
MRTPWPAAAVVWKAHVAFDVAPAAEAAASPKPTPADGGGPPSGAVPTAAEAATPRRSRRIVERKEEAAGDEALEGHGGAAASSSDAAVGPDDEASGAPATAVRRRSDAAEASPRRRRASSPWSSHGDESSGGLDIYDIASTPSQQPEQPGAGPAAPTASKRLRFAEACMSSTMDVTAASTDAATASSVGPPPATSAEARADAAVCRFDGDGGTRPDEGAPAAPVDEPPTTLESGAPAGDASFDEESAMDVAPGTFDVAPCTFVTAGSRKIVAVSEASLQATRHLMEEGADKQQSGTTDEQAGAMDVAPCTFVTAGSRKAVVVSEAGLAAARQLLEDEQKAEAAQVGARPPPPPPKRQNSKQKPKAGLRLFPSKPFVPLNGKRPAAPSAIKAPAAAFVERAAPARIGGGAPEAEFDEAAADATDATDAMDAVAPGIFVTAGSKKAVVPSEASLRAALHLLDDAADAAAAKPSGGRAAVSGPKPAATPAPHSDGGAPGLPGVAAPSDAAAASLDDESPMGDAAPMDVAAGMFDAAPMDVAAGMFFTAGKRKAVVVSEAGLAAARHLLGDAPDDAAPPSDAPAAKKRPPEKKPGGKPFKSLVTATALVSGGAKPAPAAPPAAVRPAAASTPSGGFAHNAAPLAAAAAGDPSTVPDASAGASTGASAGDDDAMLGVAAGMFVRAGSRKAIAIPEAALAAARRLLEAADDAAADDAAADDAADGAADSAAAATAPPREPIVAPRPLSPPPSSAGAAVVAAPPREPAITPRAPSPPPSSAGRAAPPFAGLSKTPVAAKKPSAVASRGAVTTGSKKMRVVAPSPFGDRLASGGARARPPTKFVAPSATHGPPKTPARPTAAARDDAAPPLRDDGGDAAPPPARRRRPPCAFSRADLRRAGVSEAAQDCGATDAERLVFRADDGRPTLPLRGGPAAPPADAAVVGCLGADDAFEALFSSGALRKDLFGDDDAARAWARNHYRWVVWKLAAVERSGGRAGALTFARVMAQLKHRFHRECEQAKVPALKAMIRRDVPAQRLIVLCVATIECGAGRPNALLLTDGWYSIAAELDAALVGLVEAGKIVVGTKIVICGAALTGEASEPLEPVDRRLQLSANGVRRARWDARLGFHCARTLRVPLSAALQGGGRIPCFDAVVDRACFADAERAARDELAAHAARAQRGDGGDDEPRDEPPRSVARVWLCAPHHIRGRPPVRAELVLWQDTGEGGSSALQDDILVEGDLVRCYWCAVAGVNHVGETELRARGKQAKFKRVASPAPRLVAARARHAPRAFTRLCDVAALARARRTGDAPFVDVAGVVVRCEDGDVVLCDHTPALVRVSLEFSAALRRGDVIALLNVTLSPDDGGDAPTCAANDLTVLRRHARDLHGKQRADFEFLETWANSKAAADAVRYAYDVQSLRCDAATVTEVLTAHGAATARDLLRRFAAEAPSTVDRRLDQLQQEGAVYVDAQGRYHLL